jgi:acyl-CoA synthetase (AMP-forming)/AMP-acid ligase II
VALWHWLNNEEALSITFHELAIKSKQFAIAFRQHAPDTIIIPIYLSKSFNCVAAMLGAIGAGKAFACLNKKLRVPQLNSILQDSSATIGLIDGAGAMGLRTELKSDMPVTQTLWWLLPEKNFIAPYKKAVAKMQELGTDIRTEFFGDGQTLSTLSDDPQRVGCCLFTSGSTGVPKGVLISEQDLRERAWAEVSWFELKPEDTLLNILPFSFDVGLNQLLSALTVGCSLVLMDSWLPADILHATANFKVNGISNVPAIWLDMLNANMVFNTSAEHQSLRYITVSGGDLSGQYLKQLPQLAPQVGIFKTYGQTEAFRATSLKPNEFSNKMYSVGQPFSGVHLYVVREDGSLCQPNEIGEIVHTGLGVMLGYLNGGDPQHKLRPNPFHSEEDNSSNAIFTGDLGYLDEDGYLFLKGRRDAMLKISGNRVYPREITNQLILLDQVQEAEVIGLKTQQGETILIAFIIPKTEVTSLQIRRYLANLLPSYMVPQEVMILTAVPRTASGKPDYPALVEQARNLLNINANG